MFEGLSERLSSILDGLTRRGALTDEDVGAALREVRRALLEADVALEVVRSFAAGPDGLELLVFGPRQEGDAEIVQDFSW